MPRSKKKSATNRVGRPTEVDGNDRSRHYEDDRWYDTEAQRDAQERRQGSKISYSDVGIRRQRPGDYRMTLAEIGQLRRGKGSR